MTQTEKLRYGILPISYAVLEQLLYLPEGYSVSGIHVNHLRRTLDFTLQSNDLPESQEGAILPQLIIYATRETLPDQPPEYRKITTEVKVL